MRIAYLVNRYPTVSHTFIRREILAIEAEGHPVDRFSVRAAPGDLPDAADRAERDRTTVILAQPLPRLLSAALAATLRSPARMLSAWRVTRPMTPRTARGFVARFAYLIEACWLAATLRRAEVAHLHAHFGTNPAAVARLVHRLTGIPYSFTVHGPDEFDEPRQIDLPGKIADAAFTVAISDYGRSQLCRWADLADWNRIVVVRCGVEADAIELAGDVPKPLDFCCVARLAPQKGLPILIDAVRRLRDAGRTVQIAVIGDGPMRDDLQREIDASGLTGQIRLLGSRDGAAVLATLGEAKAMVLPSFAEGLPVVIMESLAVGTPVVTTAVAGIPELVDTSCGWVVAPGSSAALAEAMGAALDLAPANRRAMGQEGRRRVEAAHDVRRNAAALLAHITAVPR
ncbi:MAG TPA: glycosyltransferase family 4 protein [Sphingomonas sp.]|jgi:glycosyltransferase involved in cell wall biosynthesis|nr:glycosyltransferase family 4 protein [Sphingomonas sp.]